MQINAGNYKQYITIILIAFKLRSNRDELRRAHAQNTHMHTKKTLILVLETYGRKEHCGMRKTRIGNSKRLCVTSRGDSVQLTTALAFASLRGRHLSHLPI